MNTYIWEKLLHVLITFIIYWKKGVTKMIINDKHTQIFKEGVLIRLIICSNKRNIFTSLHWKYAARNYLPYIWEKILFTLIFVIGLSVEHIPFRQTDYVNNVTSCRTCFDLIFPNVMYPRTLKTSTSLYRQIL